MIYIMSPVKWKDVNARSYPKPTVLLVDFGGLDGARYCLVGCAYGYLHDTSGNIRTWKSYSGAARIKRLYVNNLA